MNKQDYRFIDLFSGCGGLSLGLHLAGFKRVFSLEKSWEAASTYHHNFIGDIGEIGWRNWKDQYPVGIESQLQNGLVVDDIENLVPVLKKWLNDGVLQDKLGGEVDLIAGGPPCQGFSTAGRRLMDDPRNKLAWSFLEIVSVIKPKTVLIENVEGMTKKFIDQLDRSIFHEIRAELSLLGYLVQPAILNAKYYRVPQNRPRAFLLAIRSDGHDEPLFSDELFHLEKSSRVIKNCINMPHLIPRPVLLNKDSFVTVKDAFGGLGNETSRKNRDTSFSFHLKGLKNIPEPMALRMISDYKEIKNHDYRNHGKRVRARFTVLQILADLGFSSDVLYWFAHYGLEDKIDSFFSKLREDNLEDVLFLRIKDGIANFGYQFLGRSKRNKIENLFYEISTLKHSQSVLVKSKPSPTIMSIPDDYVHFSEPRVLTVREEARIQSFPDSFEFLGNPTTGGERRRSSVPQYTQVGNAVPPLLAKEIGEHLRPLIDSIANRGHSSGVALSSGCHRPLFKDGQYHVDAA